MIVADLAAIATVSAACIDWTGKYQTLQRLPPWHKAQCILEHAKQQKVDDVVSKECLCALEASSHEKVVLLLVWITQLPPT